MIKKLNRLFLAVVAIVLGTTAASAQTLTVDQTTVKMTTGTTKTIKVLLTSTDATKVRDISFDLVTDLVGGVQFDSPQTSIVSLDEGHNADYSSLGQNNEHLRVMLRSENAAVYAVGEDVEIASFDIRATASGTVLVQNIELSLDDNAAQPTTITPDDIEITVTGYDVASMITAMTTRSTTLGNMKTAIADYDSYKGTRVVYGEEYEAPKSKFMVDTYGQVDTYKTTVDGYVTDLSAQSYEFTEATFNEMSAALDEVDAFTTANPTYDLSYFNSQFINYRDSLADVASELQYDLTTLMGEENVDRVAFETYCSDLLAADATYPTYSVFALLNTTEQVKAACEELTTKYREFYVNKVVDAVVDGLTDDKAEVMEINAYKDGATSATALVGNITTKINAANTLYDDVPENAGLEVKYNRSKNYVEDYWSTAVNYYNSAMEISNSYDNMRSEMAKVLEAYTSTYAADSETPANPIRIEEAKTAYEELIGDTIVNGETVSPKYLYLVGKSNMNGYWEQMNQVFWGMDNSVEETIEFNAFKNLYDEASGICTNLSTSIDTAEGDEEDPDNLVYKYKSLVITIPETVYSKYIDPVSNPDPDYMVEIGRQDINYLLDGYNSELEDAMEAMDLYHGNVESAPATEYAGYMADFDSSTGYIAKLNEQLSTEMTTYDAAYAAAGTALTRYETQLTDATNAAVARFKEKYGVTDVKSVSANLNNGQTKTYGELLDEISYEINGYTLRPVNVDKRTAKLDSLCAHFVAQSYADADITMDEKVNIGDYTAMVNYVIGRIQNPTLVQRYKANANNDADDENYDMELYQPLVDAADITYVSNVLMGRPNNSRQRGAKAATKKENEVALELVSDEAGVRRFAVKLDNAEDYSAFQFDVTLNGDMVLADRTLGERANGQSIMSNELSENTTRVLATGLNAKTLKEGSEAIAYIDIMGEGEVELSNIRFATPDATSASAKGVVIAIDGETTGISSVKAEENVEGVYTISGVKTNKLQKGVNIVNGRKVVK